jgi:protein-disulfide isomerase
MLILGGSPSSAETAANEPLAEVNGEIITVENLDRALGAKLAQIQEQIYQLKRDELDELITQRLFMQEAAKRGISVSALLDVEITAKVALVTETEIDSVFQENKARLSGVDEATAREKVRAALQQQKLAAQRKQFVDSLRSQAKVLVRLQPPPIVRVEVSIDGAPFEGPAEAPVTFVEFSDFHCPFCKRVQTTLKQVLEQYPGKVKHVYRNLPIDGLHPQARRAAEAALCARDQGKFWEYHDMLFARAPQAAPDDLRQYAVQLGLNKDDFNRCLAGGAYQSIVQHDLDEGGRLGVSGTPAFFINGRFVNGAQPLEKFVQMIDEELARPVSGAPVSVRTQ